MLSTKAATALTQEAAAIGRLHLRDLLGDAARSRALVHELGDLRVDLSRHKVRAETIELLLALAAETGLAGKMEALFAGDPVNRSEGRAVVHMAQRAAPRIEGDGYAALAAFADDVRDSDICDVINIGIGGSDLGPAMVSAALASHGDGPRIHYVSNVDPAHLHDVLAGCAPDSTLFIVTSKTFTTAETMRNAALARDWAGGGGPGMVAVTAAPQVARDWGVDSSRLFDFDEGVGGRYSLWSAVGLPVMIGIGADRFARMLNGAAAMDSHFQAAPFAENLPVLMGLMRVWNRNFLGHAAHGIMPYDQRLRLLPAWAQQLEMESNGKSVSADGAPLGHATTPVIWGTAGTGCQHSFFQALHQGTDIVPLDILLPLRPTGLHLDGDWAASHAVLAANALAQAEALAVGSPNDAEPHRHFAGDRPSSVISWEASTPYAIGRLLALYEHVTIVSGFLWGVNSFDQWGVELGKVMARRVEAVLAGRDTPDGFSATASDLLDRIAAPADRKG
ncbi:MAG: glucose-6-phosphate isomerase [Pseudomonadota bacterium]|nr:glucose-6-phosphate isomerase [Pseudomonadota bacterium]